MLNRTNRTVVEVFSATDVTATVKCVVKFISRYRNENDYDVALYGDHRYRRITIRDNIGAYGTTLVDHPLHLADAINAANRVHESQIVPLI